MLRTRTGRFGATVARRLRSSRPPSSGRFRSEEHTSELQSHVNLVCRLLLEKKNLHSILLPAMSDRGELVSLGITTQLSDSRADDEDFVGYVLSASRPAGKHCLEDDCVERQR